MTVHVGHRVGDTYTPQECEGLKPSEYRGRLTTPFVLYLKLEVVTIRPFEDPPKFVSLLYCTDLTGITYQ